MPSYAIVLAHNRPELLARCLEAIAPQVDRIHVVDNASEPPLRKMLEAWPLNMVMYENSMQPPNLSKLWNSQLDLIERIEHGRSDCWEVAMLCDDAIAPFGWFASVQQGIRASGAAAGSTGPLGPRDAAFLETTLIANVYTRMCGWAFVLAGEKGLRADESMHWWYCDSDLDFQARQSGGMMLVPGPSVPNDLPGAWTNAKPELGTRAGLDREAFRAKWNTDF